MFYVFCAMFMYLINNHRFTIRSSMAKRAATEQLTSMNWDDSTGGEDQSAGPGHFVRAPMEQLKDRPMKTAKRTLHKTAGSGQQQGGLFAAVKLTGTGATQQATSSNSSSYLENLKSLNMSVVGWIGDHVRQNPYIDLSPVFQDYAKHLASITLSNKPTNSDEQPVSMVLSEPASTEPVSTESASSEPASTEPVSVPATEQNGDTTATDQSSREDDQAGSSETTTTTTAESDQLNCENDLMTVKSKLFYKKGTQYVELGIGILHVETPEQGSGVRLLLRNTTTIGQVLLNIRLTPSLPLSVQKNNLLVVSIPNPPLSVGDEVKEQQPVTYLIRVKTHEIASQLLSTIQKNLQ